MNTFCLGIKNNVIPGGPEVIKIYQKCVYTLFQNTLYVRRTLSIHQWIYQMIWKVREFLNN